MTSDPQVRRAIPARPGEPIAIVGVAELDPDGLDDVVVDVARFGIPPMQAKSMNRMQLLMLEAARRCLRDAGHPERPLPAERTDVVTGLCFALDRQHANAVRVELPHYAREVARAAVAAGAAPESAARAAAELRGLMARRLGGSPHDRVGEMASTIPARIATAFKLRGRTLAVESAEATSFVALAHAVGQLRADLSDAVLVLAGQRAESPFVAKALGAKGVFGPDGPPYLDAPPDRPVGAGVGAVLLKRLSTAVRDGDRVYATVLDCALRHDPRPGCFRHSHSARLRQETAADSLRAAGVDVDGIQYVERAGSGVEREAAAELEALTRLYAGRAPGSVVLGGGAGRAFAYAGLAGLGRVVLALHRRRFPAPDADGGAGRPDGTPFRRAQADEEWRVPGEGQVPRRAVIHGASLTGTFCHLVLEEHARPELDEDGGPGPVPDGHARSVTGGHARAVTGGHARAVTGGHARAVAEGHGLSVTEGRARPVAEGHAPPVVEGHPRSVFAGHARPVTEGHAPPVVEGHTPPVTEGHAPPVVEGHTPPVTEEHTPPVVEGRTPSTTEGHVPPVVDKRGQSELAVPDRSRRNERARPVADERGRAVTDERGRPVLPVRDRSRRGERDRPASGSARPRARGGAWAVAARAVPVAVVGLGGRFAGAPDAAAFWRAVRSGRTRIGPVPESVLDRDLYHSPGALSLTHTYTDQGGHVPVPDEPPDDLPVLPLRYAAMDGAQRLALDVSAELFAGHRLPTGHGIVAVGSTLGLTRERRAHTELVLQGLDDTVASLAALDGLSALRKKKLLERLRERTARGDTELSPALLDGCLASGVAALLANEYGLDAVPVAVEAACASSLAALDVAVGALRSGAADFAVAGGVELACTTRDMVLCSALGLLSHSRNAPFDAAADGFTPGDGCGLFLLKRYDDALRDGDTVHGVIRAIGASNDAKSLIAPDVAGQVRAMQRAFAQVDFEPCTVDYLEAHGTGTKVGDRVEIAAAGRLYAGGPRARPLRIGSAKSFFGHTFAAAGSAGLLRTLLALRAGTLPPNALLRTLNPALDLAAIPAEITTRPEPWPAPPGRPRRAAVSSFGTGGINYHVLVEEHRQDERDVSDVRNVQDREEGSAPR
ncbi:polyketide synthase [Streptomyces sp. NPDC059063]|uniref:polyketide synthase n=1 Tax=unclassified Streptomyces TaxID=2593676 RepID=UPI0036974295